jgi:hypothetical protein
VYSLPTSLSELPGATIKSPLVLATFAAVMIAAAALSGCSKKEYEEETAENQDNEVREDEPKTTIKIQMNNSSTSNGRPPTSITAKFAGVDLIADCAINQPPEKCSELGRSPDPDIWINAGCDDDISKCTAANTEFFELVNPAAANAVLNSQGRSIEPGTYTDVRVFFVNNDEGNAITCDGAASLAKFTIPLKAAVPTNITIAEGESVTLTLNYDTSGVDCSNPILVVAGMSAMIALVEKN